jgi:hypothetical protein
MLIQGLPKKAEGNEPPARACRAPAAHVQPIGSRDAPALAGQIQQWREISLDTSPEALAFPSERGTFMSRGKFLRNSHAKVRMAMSLSAR